MKRSAKPLRISSASTSVARRPASSANALLKAPRSQSGRANAEAAPPELSSPRHQVRQGRVASVQMIEDDGAAGLVKAEQLIDLDPIVAIHIVGGLILLAALTTATSSRVD